LKAKYIYIFCIKLLALSNQARGGWRALEAGLHFFVASQRQKRREFERLFKKVVI
jgi:hypothetical protein